MASSDETEELPRRARGKTEMRSLLDPDLSLKSLQQSVGRDRLRVRENRSPSKIYEDTLVMERKIRGFGLFSEDLTWILMSLLKDNEEMKKLIQIGFKEVEREMSELDDKMKRENKQRSKEISEIRHVIRSQQDEVEDRLGKTDKELRNKHYTLKEAIEKDLLELKHKLDDEMENITKKIPIIDEHLNDMNAKMSLVFSDQREKVDGIDHKLDRRIEEVTHLIGKTNDDLNKIVETNMEDTTLAVVTLRKDIAEQTKQETDDRIKEQNSISMDLQKTVKTIEDKLTKDLKKASDETEEMGKSVKVEFTLEIEKLKMNLCEKEMKIQKLEEETKHDIARINNCLESSLKDMADQNNEQFTSAREALSRTIEKTSEDLDTLASDLSAQVFKINHEISQTDRRQANFRDEFSDLKQKITANEEQQSKTNEIVKNNFQSVNLKSDKNFKEFQTALTNQIQRSNEIMQKNINALNEEIKNNLNKSLENTEHGNRDIKKTILESEALFNSLLNKNCDDIEMIKLKIANEKKEVELKLRDGSEKNTNGDFNDNVLLDIVSYLERMIENQKRETSVELSNHLTDHDNFKTVMYGKQNKLKELMEESMEKVKEEGRSSQTLETQKISNTMVDLEESIRSQVSTLKSGVDTQERDTKNIDIPEQG